MADGPLDMRMDPGSGEPVSAWLARADEADIARVIREYGEERFARRIARAVVRARQESTIGRTAELAAIVSAGVPSAPTSSIHPATRTLQALRIFINDELRSEERRVGKAGQ